MCRRAIDVQRGNARKNGGQSAGVPCFPPVIRVSQRVQVQVLVDGGAGPSVNGLCHAGHITTQIDVDELDRFVVPGNRRYS